jgi:hypothetical protein
MISSFVSVLDRGDSQIMTLRHVPGGSSADEHAGSALAEQPLTLFFLCLWLWAGECPISVSLHVCALPP